MAFTILKKILGVAALCLLLSKSAAASSLYFNTVEKTSHSMILEWTAPDIQWRTLQIDARSYVLPDMGLALSQQPGAPQLPFDAITVENLGSGYRVAVLDSVFETVHVPRISPAPEILVESETSTKTYSEDFTIYNQNRFSPFHFVQTNIAELQHRRFVRLQIQPIKYNPVTGDAVVLRYIRIQISSMGQGESERRQSEFDTKLSEMTAGQIGQSEIRPVLRKPAAPSAALEQVKLYTVDEGVYAVSGQELSDLGVSIGVVNPQNIKVMNRGEEISCLVTGADDGVLHEQDVIQFYAERLAGNGDYYNAFSDTNIYWLQWDAGAGRRFMSTDSRVPSTVVSSCKHLLHVEKDLEYYQGDSNAEIQDSRTVPGEGWVWDKTIDPGETFQTKFDVPHVVRGSSSATLKLRVRGETKDDPPDAHHLRVSLNGGELLDTFFDDRDELVPTIDVPTDLLLDDGNVLHIESVAQAGRLSRFFFDWFEIIYDKSLTAENGWMRVDSSSADNALRVDGFSSSDVTIWDLAHDQRINPHSSNAAWTANLRVESAAILDGNFCRFFLNEKQVYSGSRGISVVLLDAADGHIMHSKTFDTFASRPLSDSLAILLNSMPNGTILLAGVRDDGANSLTANAVAAIETFGSLEISNLAYRHSWAFIGRKGESVPLAENRRAPSEGSVTADGSVEFSSGDATINVQFLPASAVGPFVLFEPSGIKSPLKMKRRIDNSATTLTGADYLIITDKKFFTEAQRLADYRAGFNSFTTAVVDLDDIYDAMSFGIRRPDAIKDFLINANSTWSPQPKFVLLFGDASWDPKNIFAAPFSNYIPSLGNPVSDALFVCFDGEEDFLPDVSIGRIPAKTLSDARTSVDKIIEYESTPSARWKKRFLFINGGLDESEQKLFQKQSVALADDFVDADPVYGEPLFISKNDANAQADPRSLILDALNNGALWTNFIGHAASRTWELMFNNPDIDDLSNQGRYPFISSMTCHTGRFAEPTQDSFGEKFLLVPNKGAIGFWGTSGWGYSYEDYLYLRQLYPTVLNDGVRYLGDIIRLTKFGLWSRYGAGAHIRNLILQYNLMGDPALTLDLPTKPDLTIEPQDIVVHPLTPSESDSTAALKLRVQNWGPITPDSVQVDVAIEQLVTKHSVNRQLALPAIGRMDSLSFDWPLRHMAGPVEIRATVDPLDLVSEDDETNNAQAGQVTVLTSTFAQVAPLNNSLLPDENVRLKIQTPQQYFDEDARYIFEIDTSESFSSSALKVSPPIQAHPLLIKWEPTGVLPNVKYFWRVRLQDGDAGQSFVGSFYTSSESRFGWQQADGKAAKFNTLDNIEWQQTAHLGQKAVSVLLQSAWTNSVGFALIEIDGISPLTTARGVNVVVLNQHSGAVIKTGHFDTYADANQAAALVDFIEEIAPGRIVLAAVSDEASRFLNENARTTLQAIGSARIGELGYRDMWAIVGKKGAAPGSVVEDFAKAQANGAVVLKDTLSVLHTSGRMLSERIGPATRWDLATLDVTIPDSSDYSVDVIGYNKVLGDTVRLVSNQKSSTIDLAAIDAETFPYLFLEIEFTTENSSQSPQVNSWNVMYEPAPDLTVGRQLVAQSADTVLVGQTVTFYLDVYNIGLTTAKKVPISVDQINQVGRNEIINTTIDSIAVDRYAPMKFSWQAGAVPGEKFISISVDPHNVFEELSEANNSVITSVYVHSDTVKPDIHITFDDREIFDGDLVAAEPKIVAKLMDNNPELRIDSTRIKIFLDGVLLSMSDHDFITLHESPSQDALAELHIQPTLEDGRHILEIQFSDQSLNAATKRVDFTVESDLALRDVLNYPNPFEQDTEFCFQITQQATISIKIYTVAGRLIQTLEPGIVDVGYNRIYWDGRDSSGDQLANGVYLYNMIARTDGETTTVTSKVIVMR